MRAEGGEPGSAGQPSLRRARSGIAPREGRFRGVSTVIRHQVEKWLLCGVLRYQLDFDALSSKPGRGGTIAGQIGLVRPTLTVAGGEGHRYRGGRASRGIKTFAKSGFGAVFYGVNSTSMTCHQNRDSGHLGEATRTDAGKAVHQAWTWGRGGPRMGPGLILRFLAIGCPPGPMVFLLPPVMRSLLLVLGCIYPRLFSSRNLSVSLITHPPVVGHWSTVVEAPRLSCGGG